MREYKKVTKSYETNEISKCICDKCGVECAKTITDLYDDDRRTLLQIQPQYSGDNHISLDLCPKCTRELLAWFPKNEEIDDLIDTLDMWESD